METKQALARVAKANLFETPDNTPRTLAQAIKEVLNIDYNGQQRSNVLVGDTATSQRGQQRSTGDAATGERTEDGERTADSAGGIGVSNDERRRQGNISDTSRRQQSYSPQEEIDENGHPFVVSSDGTTSFGEIREESGLPAAPIKLSEGYQDENGKGYGLVHIEANHGEQIRDAGFKSVEEYVSFVAKNYEEDNIRVGKLRDNIGTTTYLIQVTDEHDNTLFIELSRDGSYWNVNSGGIFRKGYSNKKETVVKTEPQQPNNAVSTGSSLSADDRSGISATEPNGEPTVSDSKDTTISPTTNELGEKSAAPSVQEQIQAAEAEVNTNPTEAQKEAGREPQRRQEGAVTDAEIEALNAEISENYRTNSELDKDNERFNNELQQQIDGTLPKGHIYKMGMPGKILLSEGVPNMPIEMSSTRLEEKSKQDNHPFEISELKNLVKELQSPIAVFKYGNNAKNVIISIDYQGKQFLVGIYFNQNRNGIEVSSIRGDIS